MSLPTTNITTSMVSSAIGLGSHDVGALCSSSNINKWSRWKPVKSTSPISESILSSVNYGLSLPSGSSDYISAANQSWIYNKPNGSDSGNGYRLGDFRNYNHDATSPIGILTKDISHSLMYGGVSLPISYLFNPSGNTDNIGLSEVSSILNLYLCAIFVNGGNAFAVTSDTTLGNGAQHIIIDLSSYPFSTGTNYIMYNVLSAQSRAQGSSIGSNIYYPIPTSSNCIGSLSFNSDSMFSSDTKYVSSGTSWPFTLSSIDDYQSGNYFATTGALFLNTILTNTSTGNITLNMSNFKFYVSETLNRSTSYTGDAVIYDSSGNNISNGSVTVPNGSSITLTVGSTNALKINSSGLEYPVSPDTKKTISYTLKYNNYIFASLSLLNTSGA